VDTEAHTADVRLVEQAGRDRLDRDVARRIRGAAGDGGGGSGHGRTNLRDPVGREQLDDAVGNQPSPTVG
jgi:hypothetical protein